METEQMVSLVQLLNAAIGHAETCRSAAFEADDPAECRKWLTRRDHLREARSAVLSMISDANTEVAK